VRHGKAERFEIASDILKDRLAIRLVPVEGRGRSEAPPMMVYALDAAVDPIGSKVRSGTPVLADAFRLAL
jgi:hypothetical protein